MGLWLHHASVHPRDVFIGRADGSAQKNSERIKTNHGDSLGVLWKEEGLEQLFAQWHQGHNRRNFGHKPKLIEPE